MGLPSGGMNTPEKSCPVVIRAHAGPREILAFVHPNGDKQLVKGTIEANETPLAAAYRELQEESGIIVSQPMKSLGTAQIGAKGEVWHFFICELSGLPDTWDHQTTDDGGHIFSFFWHPLHAPLDDRWDPIFQQASAYLLPLVPK